MPKYRLGRLRGGYVAVYYDESGARHRNSLGTDSKVAAQAAVDDLNKREESAPGQTVRKLWDSYRQEKAGHRIAESMLTTWKALEPTFGDRVAESIGDETVHAYIKWRRQPTEAIAGLPGIPGKPAYPNGRSDGTIWTELNHLRIVMEWAKKRNRIQLAPYIPMPPKPAPRDRWLSRSDVQLLIDNATSEHVRLFIILAITTGGRKEALLTLTWEQIDFVRGIIHLDDQQSTQKRKGRASVPMNKSVRVALVEARKAALSKYVIEWNGAPVKSVKRSLAKTAEKARLEDVTAHVFRHSAARWQAEAGIPMSKIAQYLGHSDSRITEKVYARFAPGHMQDAADVLDIGFAEVQAIG
ncbi:tyrosine-type recombinase/integrase [Aminobacter sp. UC22_36]|uniref:tyrosine-type recombinase/integrase n=1 Tax=Aminobacter sp. UC22_36 TaxID=3374549 RepID=UPI003757D176